MPMESVGRPVNLPLGTEGKHGDPSAPGPDKGTVPVTDGIVSVLHIRAGDGVRHGDALQGR